MSPILRAVAGAMAPRLRRFAAAATMLVVAGCSELPDRNGDARIRIACIGDSNTFDSAAGPSWCIYLGRLAVDQLGPRASTRIAAFPGVTAVTTGDTFNGSSKDGEAYVQRAIHSPPPRPDYAVLAFGINDVKAKFTAERITARLLEMRATLERAGIQTYVSLIPPLVEPYAAQFPVERQILDGVNARLRQRLRADRLIDFANIPAGDFAADTAPPFRLREADGIHLNDTGQRRRARLALNALLAAWHWF